MGRGRHTSSKPAKYMKYTYDTRANKMEEGRITIQVKKRAMHDDTKFWGKTDPTFGGNPPAIRRQRVQLSAPIGIARDARTRARDVARRTCSRALCAPGTLARPPRAPRSISTDLPPTPRTCPGAHFGFAGSLRRGEAVLELRTSSTQAGRTIWHRGARPCGGRRGSLAAARKGCSACRAAKGKKIEVTHNSIFFIFIFRDV